MLGAECWKAERGLLFRKCEGEMVLSRLAVGLFEGWWKAERGLLFRRWEIESGMAVVVVKLVVRVRSRAEKMLGSCIVMAAEPRRLGRVVGSRCLVDDAVER